MVASDILRTIGRTPVVRLARLFPDHQVFQKQERVNPGGSIKDRVALAMVEDAEARGLISKQTLIVEPTSGNTGIGLAMVCAVKGYRLVLVMPESMSLERWKVMAAYGAQCELTPKEKGMKGAIARAEEMIAENEGSWMPSQFDNPANVEVHHRTTAPEVLEDFPDGLDCLITGVGTGGHITGMAEVLKRSWPDLEVRAVEPEKSPVISGGEPSPHRIQGIGAGFVPANLRLDVIDGTVQVSEAEAVEWARLSARHEGILVGMSTGASLAAVAKTLPKLRSTARVLTLNYDSGERYLSLERFLP